MSVMHTECDAQSVFRGCGTECDVLCVCSDYGIRCGVLCVFRGYEIESHTVVWVYRFSSELDVMCTARFQGIQC